MTTLAVSPSGDTTIPYQFFFQSGSFEHEPL